MILRDHSKRIIFTGVIIRTRIGIRVIIHTTNGRCRKQRRGWKRPAITEGVHKHSHDERLIAFLNACMKKKRDHTEDVIKRYDMRAANPRINLVKGRSYPCIGWKSIYWNRRTINVINPSRLLSFIYSSIQKLTWEWWRIMSISNLLGP